MKIVNYDQLTEQQRELLDAAEKAMEDAYQPSHGYFVGAALLTSDNQIITGWGIEESVHDLTPCAEMAALKEANSQGYRSYKSIAFISGSYDSDTEKIIGPCNDCRRMMEGYAGPDLEVILSTAKKDRIVVTSIDKLP